MRGDKRSLYSLLGLKTKQATPHHQEEKNTSHVLRHDSMTTSQNPTEQCIPGLLRVNGGKERDDNK